MPRVTAAWQGSVPSWTAGCRGAFRGWHMRPRWAGLGRRWHGAPCLALPHLTAEFSGGLAVPLLRIAETSVGRLLGWLVLGGAALPAGSTWQHRHLLGTVPQQSLVPTGLRDGCSVGQRFPRPLPHLQTISRAAFLEGLDGVHGEPLSQGPGPRASPLAGSPSHHLCFGAARKDKSAPCCQQDTPVWVGSEALREWS